MAQKSSNYKTAWKALAVGRIILGLILLWAFFDKTFGWYFATKPTDAWINGGSPTTGFLQFGVNGGSPFADFFTSLAGQAWVDWLFMAGLLGIGLALVLGIGLRIAAVTGTVLMLLLWMAEMPSDNNPALDDHLVYAAVMIMVATGRREWSLTNWWLSLGFVKKNKWLW
ncbi:DoxX family protein [Candidatus Saccharibacteria bacterium RAAC3_TM7_1]|nr:DoxX family protein [Candidatus Saccharibacteria bacterium RAAC3_TM7_1]HCZ28659.1 DoxX family membrane protein [Candidatus Saccharibacteria bacterium]